MKQYKLILEHGIRLFSQKPSKGIKFFKEKGLIEDSLESVAKFLLTESDRLDKTAIGMLKYNTTIQDWLVAIIVSLKNYFFGCRGVFR